MRWARLIAVLATAIIGLGGAYAIWTFDDAPRWTIAVSGLLGAAGAAATLLLAIVIGATIVEDVRPSFRFRKPAVPLSLAHREAAMVGSRRYRLHPIRFWGGLTLNNKFGLVFMIFDQPEYINFKDDKA